MSIKADSTLMFASKLTKVLLDVFSIMLLSRFLMLDEYGFYRQFLVSNQLLTSILVFGLPASTMYFLSSKKRKEYLPNIYFALGILAIVTLVLSPLLVKLFDINFKVIFFSDNIFLLSIIYSTSIFVAASENMLIALQKVKFIPIYIILPNLFWFFGILTITFLNMGIEFVLVIFLVRVLLYFSLTIFFISEKFDFSLLSKKKIKEVVLFGLPIGISSIVGLLSLNIDKLVIGNLYDTETFAIFANGAYEIPFLAIIGGSLFNVIIPRLKETYENNEIKKTVELWHKAGLTMISIIIPIAATFIVFSKTSVLFLFSDKYLESVPFFRLYQVRLFFRIFLYGSFFISTGKSHLYLVTTTISLFLNLILDITFVNLIGPIGAVIATLITLSNSVVIHIWNISRILKVSFKKVFPWKKWAFSIIITLVVSSLIHCIYTYLTSNITVGIIFMAFSFIVNFLILSKLVDSQLYNYAISLFTKFKKIRLKVRK